MPIRVLSAAPAAWLLIVASALAQFQEGDPAGSPLGESRVQRWRVGVVVTASGGACRALRGSIPVPTDWPEQRVRVVEEDVSAEARVTYRMVQDSVKQMLVSIRYLPAGAEAKALVTLEIERSAQLPPENTDIYVLPDPKKLDSSLRRRLAPYLAPSPYIESRHARIKDLAKEIPAGKQKAWEKVEAIYDWVRANVRYVNGRPKGALAALKDGSGDCEELTGLFIAICRAAEIPARTVWVPGHCYPEFFLLDDEGKGHWFPCQAAGTRAFGAMSEFRPILQKGDNFRAPDNPRKRIRYLYEHLIGTPVPGGGKPRCRFLREQVAQ